MNELYRMIQQSSSLKNKVKLIGIGAGNSPFEVDFFRKRYKVPFPLFADRDLTIHKTLGEVRTPYFIAVRLSSNGTHQVVYSKLGAFKNIRRFLQLLLNLSGIR